MRSTDIRDFYAQSSNIVAYWVLIETRQTSIFHHDREAPPARGACSWGRFHVHPSGLLVESPACKSGGEIVHCTYWAALSAALCGGYRTEGYARGGLEQCPYLNLQ